jgi:aldose 1-epimerase
MAASAHQAAFGALSDGRAVHLVTLSSPAGLELRIMTLGAAVQALLVPDAAGNMADVVLGHDHPEDYRRKRQFFGGTIGRLSNRIAGGCFDLGGETVRIPTNEGDNVLHGGPEGFDTKLWAIDALGTEPLPFVRLSLLSSDGDGGFPGTVQATVTYALSEPNELTLTFEAETDRPTVMAMTHHSYFNLAGVEQLGSALHHRLTVAADRFLPMNASQIPTGDIRDVTATPFDFREAKAINRDLRTADEQLLVARGYDHCLCLSETAVAEPRFAARLEDPGSGRVLELLTDQPGLQVYSGNMLDGSTSGKYGQIYRPGDAICLEPQAWPDAPNHLHFPSVRLEPGALYRHRSIYRFSATKPS